MRLEQLRLVRHARPRADERHVALEDVDELRQLVQAEPAQPAAGRGHVRRLVELVEAARVGGGGGVHDRLHIVAMDGDVSVGAHRPELEHRERHHPAPEPVLAEEHGPARVELDRERDDREQRRDEQQHEERAHDVDDALDDAAGRRQRARREAQ